MNHRGRELFAARSPDQTIDNTPKRDITPEEIARSNGLHLLAGKRRYDQQPSMQQQLEQASRAGRWAVRHHSADVLGYRHKRMESR